ncbi:hypothetical protein QNH98_16355 [Myroides sp. mNGS23_01]|nr:hypothetical protein [Myroides sp. mNGS23_01]WHT38556.1 hypothetical protein QNH98_16355 [Myroides sp. mNGS23_01]
MQTVIREKGVSLLQYYPNTGSEELHALLIKRAALHGATLQKEELLVTDGALQALYIALAATTTPHDIVAVESPCVFSVLEVLSNLRLRALEIPVRPVHGFDIAYLKKCANNTPLKRLFLHLISTIQRAFSCVMNKKKSSTYLAYNIRFPSLKMMCMGIYTFRVKDR